MTESEVKWQTTAVLITFSGCKGYAVSHHQICPEVVFQAGACGPKISEVSCNEEFLEPFHDNKDVLRIRARLKHSPLSEEACHPIILPKAHHVSKLSKRHIHKHASRHTG